ncbi:MAG: tRNA pseudouridine(54/55) synthase Pus10 [Promethearchaeota archaeon]
MEAEINNNNREQSILDSLRTLITNYPLCTECLGRQYSLLGHGLTNTARAKSLLNTLLMQMHKDLDKEGLTEEERAKLIVEIRKIAQNAPYSIAKNLINLDEKSGSNIGEGREDSNKDKGESKVVKGEEGIAKGEKTSKGNGDIKDNMNNNANNNPNNNANKKDDEVLQNNSKNKDLLNKPGRVGGGRNINNNFTCFICNNLFFQIPQIVEAIIEKVRFYEFNNFLVGTNISGGITDREDELRAFLRLENGESFKKNFNRVIGIKLQQIFDKPVEFAQPELNILVELKRNNQYNIKVVSNPLCIMGRYHKYERGIPQTHWPHRACKGKGCPECNFTGKQYETSVEELLSQFFLKYAQSKESKFHGAGREDIDARCLGNGRPFILELKHPKVRDLPLKKIEEEIREKVGHRVDAYDLKIVPRTLIKELKSKGESIRKTYEILVKFENKISKEEFKEQVEDVIKKITSTKIIQRTPLRVAHRRADKVREKRVYSIQYQWLNENQAKFIIEAMGGTYIKELVSGDNNRTRPSFSELFNNNMKVEQLDVIHID